MQLSITVLLLAYVGGILTIVSPCILPVLPFVFARADQPFRRSGLPMLGGMAVTFAAVASLAAVTGGWAVRANQYGRIAALALFGIFGLTLLFSSLAERLSRPLVQLGNRLTQTSQAGLAQSFLLGVGTGFLWAPCAGPILGLVLTGAVLGGANLNTSLLLLLFAVGAVTSLALALLAGGRVFAAMKRSLAAEVWLRRILGVAVLAGVAGAAFGLDRGLLSRLSLSTTGLAEQKLVDLVRPARQAADVRGNDPGILKTLSAADGWINSAPLNSEFLKGKVVVIDFWTYSCINCLRTLPYLKAWNAKYQTTGLVIIGVHTPEFPFEKDEQNVRNAVHDLGIIYPVALDDNYGIWRGFNNEYWPAHYFIDANGRVRYHHFGEGNYAQSEAWIRSLLEEANYRNLPGSPTQILAAGTEAAPDAGGSHSPETYVGYDGAERFVSPGGLDEDEPKNYRAPAHLDLNTWALSGKWKDEGQSATLVSPSGGIVYRFRARDLHLVLGPAIAGKPVRFRVTIDGKVPGPDHGLDINANGDGAITGQRLYQLIRQKKRVEDHLFEIKFLDSGAQAYAFTFG